MTATVLITGASTGIGRAAALALAERGYTVFAGVRHDTDAPVHKRVIPIRIDVTDPELIAAAVDHVAAATDGGLDALVNNAGIGAPWPMELVPLPEFRRHLEVNLVGQLAMTQAFLPLLKRSRGRLINIGSEGGRITLPFLGPITASKHGLVSITAAFRMELRPWGVTVSIVEPGATKSNAPEKLVTAGRRAIAESFSEVARADYAETFGRVIDKIATGHERQGSAPEVIAGAVVRAVTDRRPKTRYPIGGHAKLLTRLARFLPDRAMEQLFLRQLGINGKKA